jgi:hypothetical protein
MHAACTRTPIPYQDPQQAAERLKAVHEARVKIVPQGLSNINPWRPTIV